MRWHRFDRTDAGAPPSGSTGPPMLRPRLAQTLPEPRAAGPQDAFSEPLPVTDISRSNEESVSHQLARLRTLTETGYAELRTRCPDIPDLGGCLLLGRRYANEAGVLFLGINPGGARQPTHLDTDLQLHDFLLEGPQTSGHWQNARVFFGSSTLVRSRFAAATFGFCCPYRTTSWDLPPRQREVLVEVSRPVLQQMMADCRPRLIAVAGRTAFTLLQEILSPEFVVLASLGRGGPGGAYQWAAHRARWRNDDTLLVQVPHFSRANSGSRLQECALWLADGLRRWSVAV